MSIRPDTKVITCNDIKNYVVTKIEDVSPDLLADAKPLLPQACEIVGAARSVGRRRFQ